MDPHPTDRPRLLVVDDDEIMRDLLWVLLGELGYQITLCSSGEEAVEALQHGLKPALILTDLQMTGLEGLNLVLALRAANSTRAVVLGMSAGVPSPELLAHLDAFLSKPFDMAQFENAVQNARKTNADRLSSPTTSVAELPGLSPTPSAPDRSLRTDATTAPALDDAIVTALSKTLQRGQLRELYLLTLQDVAKRFARIQGFAERGDLAALQREAHAIKGSCGMVGARELQTLATALEGGTTVNTSVLDVFPAACDRLRRMLDEKLQLS